MNNRARSNYYIIILENFIISYIYMRVQLVVIIWNETKSNAQIISSKQYSIVISWSTYVNSRFDNRRTTSGVGFQSATACSSFCDPGYALYDDCGIWMSTFSASCLLILSSSLPGTIWIVLVGRLWRLPIDTKESTSLKSKTNCKVVKLGIDYNI